MVVVALTAGLSACADPGQGGYRLTAYFPRAVALYEQSRVKVMGVDVGTVRVVEVEPDRVRVEMSIDDDVPLPADVEASIVPLTLIGERNVVLHPPWHPGQPRAGDGDVIPESRTHVPVEPDEALQAITDLARAIDPDAVQRLVTGGAAALSGRGGDLNAALAELGSLAEMLASQDEALLDVAANVHTLAAALNSREAQLGRLLDDFAAATDVLASERDAIGAFLDALVRLTNEGNALLETYEVQLPTDVSRLAEVALTIQADADSVQQLLQALAVIGDGVTGAYDPVNRDIRVRIIGSPTLVATLQPLFDLLGLGAVPCIPLDTLCP
ncbi:MAG: MCE family protein [Chloroflexi bacterium]|nr:MCE family protein [Chloroflexota bacterium]